MSNDFLFASDESPTPQDAPAGTGNAHPVDPAAPPWLVLVADDEPEVHAVTRLALARLRFRGRPVRLLDCTSAAEAERILRATPDIAVILLDVVMETEDAGLQLVRRIREDLGNRTVRIILRTGQPARVPEEELVLAYEIDGYTAKTELTARRLFTSVVTALRAYADLAELERQLAERSRALEEATVRLNRMAMLDPLTGVWNRRRFLELAAAELARARRYGRPLGVFLIDLDGFKAVNDAYGNAIGDAVLRGVVKRVRAALRISDHIARSGGEEFVVLLPETDSAGAIVVAERVRAALADSPILVEERAISVTACIGVANWLPGEPGVEQTLHRAEHALHAAKQAGRNRVERATG
ncbi:diguanylate cyclase (GGDEF)-like protein [Azospirillum lipoferum]|uniref:diguanylate cyclase n=1 Tax=Azospirillum lipoferum TaxID=193 RepID=A0A5A9GWQ7_AZOLI|nr:MULTISPECIES: diguanylate cyclase [Azospirillum]KAA0597889.1 diguanylate cyclase [Azospirillum lipoferum]MCP1609969.1 diguanylate cyclase (GGDEF)-like protein [Azospirillum lipoferum]MDW5534538.1 diguanylate cyclase [Azospirillum sp. NL1]